MLFISGSAIPAEQLDLGDDHVAVLPHRRHPMGLEPEPLPEARLHQHRPAPPLVMQNEQDTRGGVVPLRRVQVASDRNTGHFWETSPFFQDGSDRPRIKGGMSKTTPQRRKPIFLPAGGGRSYPMGHIAAIFKADNAETGRAYSVSEWWLEPNTKGPDAHSNDEDHVWYVIEGTMSVLIDQKWIDAPKGSFVLIPGGVMHNFENRSKERAGILNFNSSAGFEDEIPGISEWFAKNPPGDAEWRRANSS